MGFAQWVFSSVKELLQTALNIYESASNYLKSCRLFRNDVGVKDVLVALFCDFCKGSVFCKVVAIIFPVGLFPQSKKVVVVKNQVFLISSLPY